MKEKLTFEKVCADVAADCERKAKGTVGAVIVFAIISLLMLFIYIMGEGSVSIGIMLAMMIILVVYIGLVIFLYYLRMKKAKNGQLYVVRDIMYRRDIVRKGRGRSRVRVKTLFLQSNGKFELYPADDDAVYHETECGETVYLVYAGLFPNKILYAYSGGKYEPDFEVRLL